MRFCLVVVLSFCFVLGCVVHFEPIKGLSDSEPVASVEGNVLKLRELQVSIGEKFTPLAPSIEIRKSDDWIDGKGSYVYEYYPYIHKVGNLVDKAVVIVNIRFEKFQSKAYWYHGNENDPFAKVNSIERNVMHVGGKKIYSVVRYNTKLYSDIAGIAKKHSLTLMPATGVLDQTLGYVTNDRANNVRIMYLSAVNCPGLTQKSVISTDGQNCLNFFKEVLAASLKVE